MPQKSVDLSVVFMPYWGPTVPVAGPAYVVEAVRQHGYTAEFIDYNVRLFRKCEALGYGQLWDSSAFPFWKQGLFNALAQWVDIDEIHGEVVGFSITASNLSFSVAVAQRIRQKYPHKKIIFGGHGVFSEVEASLVPASAVDVLVKGEGEATIVEVLQHDVNQLDDVAGLYLAREGQWRLTRERPLVTDLDQVAWPKYEDIDLTQYKNPYIGLWGSRGCVGRCVFCNERLHSPGYRVRSAGHQADELEYLSNRFRVGHFPYYDALYNGDYRNMREKSEEILRRGLTVDYSGNMMVRHDMPDELFPLLRKSGFSVAFIGIESGSASVLRAMRKRHNPQMAAAFLKKCHAAGIRTEVNFIIGFPTETEEDFLDTLHFISENKTSIDTIISANAFMPGGEVLDNLERLGIAQGFASVYDWRTIDNSNNNDVRHDRLRRFFDAAGQDGLLSDALVSNKVQIFQDAAPDIRPLLIKLGIVRQCSVVEKVVTNIRQKGIRDTVRRGREWFQIRLKQR